MGREDLARLFVGGARARQDSYFEIRRNERGAIDDRETRPLQRLKCHTQRLADHDDGGGDSLSGDGGNVSAGGTGCRMRNECATHERRTAGEQLA